MTTPFQYWIVNISISRSERACNALSFLRIEDKLIHVNINEDFPQF